MKGCSDAKFIFKGWTGALRLSGRGETKDELGVHTADGAGGLGHGWGVDCYLISAPAGEGCYHHHLRGMVWFPADDGFL